MTKKPTLPEYHRGYTAGLDDAAGLLRTLAEKQMPMAPDPNAVMKVTDALELFREQIENLALAVETKSNTAREIAFKMMASPFMNGGSGGQA